MLFPNNMYTFSMRLMCSSLDGKSAFLMMLVICLQSFDAASNNTFEICFFPSFSSSTFFLFVCAFEYILCEKVFPLNVLLSKCYFTLPLSLCSFRICHNYYNPVYAISYLNHHSSGLPFLITFFFVSFSRIISLLCASVLCFYHIASINSIRCQIVPKEKKRKNILCLLVVFHIFSGLYFRCYDGEKLKKKHSVLLIYFEILFSSDFSCFSVSFQFQFSRQRFALQQLQ